MNTNEMTPDQNLKPEEEKDQLTLSTEDTEQHDELQPGEDFTSLSREELFARMEEIYSQTDIENSRGTIQKIKDQFREMTKEEFERKRNEWETSKEDEHDVFMPSVDHLAEKFEDVLKKYNQKRAEQKRQKENDLRKNLQKKEELPIRYLQQNSFRY